MDINELRAFVTIAELKSFSLAAEKLHLSQPAVSKRIALLEQKTGHSLFDRIGRNVSITEAGQALLPHAQNILGEIDASQKTLSRLSDEVSGTLTIGTSHHIGLHRLPPVLRAFSEDYPNVELDIQFMDSEQACHAVEQGTMELGIVTLPDQPAERLMTQEIWPDPMGIVVSPRHELAQRKQLTLADLVEYPALLPDANTFTHNIIHSTFTAHGLKPEVRLATNYLETLKMLVSTGLGWSALPLSMADEDICVLEIPDFTISRSLGIVRHKRRSLSRAADAMLMTINQNMVV